MVGEDQSLRLGGGGAMRSVNGVEGCKGGAVSMVVDSDSRMRRVGFETCRNAQYGAADKVV